MTDPRHSVDSISGSSSTEIAMLRLTATAYHEAGHAVMALALGRIVGKVTIEPSKSQYGGARLGTCNVDKERYKSSKTWLEDEVMILLAGMVAESHFTENYCERGATQDLKSVRRLLETRIRTQRQLERLEKRMLNKAEHILDEPVNRKSIEVIAAELLEKNTITGRAVRHFYHQTQQQHS